MKNQIENILQYLLFLSAVLPHTLIFFFLSIDNENIFTPLLIVRIPLSGYLNLMWRVCVYKNKINILLSQQTSRHPQETCPECHWWAVLGHFSYPTAPKGAIQLELKLFWYLQQNLHVWILVVQSHHRKPMRNFNMQRFVWEIQKYRVAAIPIKLIPNGSWLIWHVGESCITPLMIFRVTR